jgi:two-component system, LytTR family, response regulator
VAVLLIAQTDHEMISTIIIENNPQALAALKTKIEHCCPYLDVNGVAQTAGQAWSLLQHQTPKLAFVNPEVPFFRMPNNQTVSSHDMELILISDTPAFVLEAVQMQAVGYLFRPIEEETFVSTVVRAKERILVKEESKRNKQLLEKLIVEKKTEELIGIPTIEGYEFIKANEIIRCEGLQRCTRVVTVTKTDIVSSYNIGEFISLLEPYHFFSPHKSHLINLGFVRKYLREGTIVLEDKTCIPVAKRRKSEFLNLVTHL